jgi:predicted outer membrane protein
LKDFLVGQIYFVHVQTDSEQAQIPTVSSIDQVTQAILDNLRAGGNQFQEQEDDNKGQSMQSVVSALQSLQIPNLPGSPPSHRPAAV